HTLSIMMVPPGHEQPMHGHETEEIFFVLEGECTVVWQKDGERAEVRLGKWDMILSPPTADHCIINHSDQPCWFQVMLGKAKPRRSCRAASRAGERPRARRRPPPAPSRRGRASR